MADDSLMLPLETGVVFRQNPFVSESSTESPRVIDGRPADSDQCNHAQTCENSQVEVEFEVDRFATCRRPVEIRFRTDIPPPMKAELVPENGDPPIPILRDVTVVGRHPECDVVINEVSLSKRHCVFVKTDGLLVIRDLATTNGTKVKGQRVRWAALLPDDKVSLGGYKVRVYLGSDEMPSPSEHAATEAVRGVHGHPNALTAIAADGGEHIPSPGRRRRSLRRSPSPPTTTRRSPPRGDQCRRSSTPAQHHMNRSRFYQISRLIDDDDEIVDLS